MAFTAAEQRAYRALRKAEGNPVPRGGDIEKPPRRYLGIDTEGETGEDGKHRTTMISYSDFSGHYTKTLRALPGMWLATHELLDFIAEIPPGNTLFGYSFGYDISKVIEDLEPKNIYHLMRPNTRELVNSEQPWRGRKPIVWEGFRINLDNLKLSVRKQTPKGVKPGKAVAIWDIIRFCQAPFVAKYPDDKDARGALEMWGIGTREERDIIRRMKVKRSTFTAAELDEIEQYNLLECRLLAALAEKIMTSHAELRTPTIPDGLELKTRFDGPGSSVTKLIKVWKLEEMFDEMRAQRDELPLELTVAILCAYFGGRFENRIIGATRGFNYDINSAYPYHACQLPCILHGRWYKTKDRSRIEKSCLAVIHWQLRCARNACRSWGPLPIRLEDGCITYPEAAGGGWAWRDEYRIAESSGQWPGLSYSEAWVYERTCVCPNPLKQIAELYKERDLVGKNTGLGIVLKLVMNSIYGKMAQTVGQARYNSWIYAGLITSGCRAQLLEAICAHSNPSKVVAVATDGILSTEELELPMPKATGAENCKKPLGGWDKETTPEIFLIRPGMYVGAKMKTRGITKSTLERVSDAIVEDWNKYHDAERYVMAPGENRFIGARQGVYYVPGTGAYKRRADYGNWVTRPQRVSFNPRPKRDRALADGTLVLRNLSGTYSVPYHKGLEDEEPGPIEWTREEELDQPDVSDPIEYV